MNLETLLRPTVRRWLYQLAAAGLAIAGVYGLIDGQQLAAWMGLASALFGLAAMNTPTPEQDR